VSKKDGIYAPKASNLILQTEAGKPSIFLFNPDVKTNAHPHATVQFKSTKSFRVNSSNLQWERFGLPTWKTIESIECDQPALVTNIQIFGASGWENLGNLTGSTFDNKSKLNKPFISCNLLANTLSPTPAGAVYSFGGELTGNMDVNLNVFTEWTPFANSYSAHMNVEAMLAGLSSAENETAAAEPNPFKSFRTVFPPHTLKSFRLNEWIRPELLSKGFPFFFSSYVGRILYTLL
jgi:hypothetical protein